MKIYSCCPVCRKESKIEFKRRMLGLSKQAKIEIDELFTKITDGKEASGLLSVCMNCRLVYNKKFYDDEELAYVYNKGYFLMEERIKELPGFVYDDEDFLNAYSKRIFDKVKFLEVSLNRQIEKIWDIGGRDGFMFKDLAEEGYDCTVFDPIPRAPYTDKIMKVDVWASQIDSKESADLVLLCDVLAHCVDPMKEVANCFGLLKEEGVLYIEVPYDLGTFFKWLFLDRLRRIPLSVDITHFSYFSIRSILMMLQESGFRSIHISFDFLPSVDNVLLLNVIAQKDSIVDRNESPKNYSYGFDLIKSNFVRLLIRMVLARIFGKRGAGGSK